MRNRCIDLDWKESVARTPLSAMGRSPLQVGLFPLVGTLAALGFMSSLTENIVVGLVLAGAAAVLFRQARGYWRGDRKCCSRGCGDKPAEKPGGQMFLPVEDLERRAKDKERKT